jgi:N-acetylglutamate synthase-like GNAT family acetyltransferase
VEVLPFAPELQRQVIDLIVDIQRNEFGIPITAEQQPDLARIPSFYQVRSGNFWVARAAGEVVGTIALLDIGAQQGALRKMFVRRDFRGSAAGTAQRLLDTLLGWSSERAVREIFLGTTEHFRAAHRFYEKNGFREIAKAELPDAFPVMEVDTRFYHYGPT